MTPADNTPDFDSMSPEEIMAWMESLAKRQGANAEELTTSADVDIPEIDPDSVVIDEPGYVPYGEERPETPTRPVTPPRAPVPEAGPPPAPQPPARPQPPPPARPSAPVWQSIPPRPSAPPPRPPFQPPQRPAEPIKPPPVPEPAARAETDAMSWLEDLAAGQGDLLFNLDLNALTDELEHRAPDAAATPTDPMAWLENLAGEDDSLDLSALTTEPPAPATEEPAADAVADPFASGVDPMAWLENLARRQGARSEELTTSTPMNIPVPENVVIDEPGYKPFSFDSPIEPRRPAPVEPLQLDDPAAWLDSLAEAQGFDEALVLGGDKPAEGTDDADPAVDDAAIEQAIASGTVSPEQMQAFLERQTDLYVQSLEEKALLGDDEPPVPADLPDWLLEQVGPPPEGGWPVSETGPVLSESIVEPPPATDFPDWLDEDFPTADELDLAGIFADAGDLYEEPTPEGIDVPIEVDPSDPWVEAFDLEREQGEGDLNVLPDWYERNLSDPERIAAVEQLAQEGQDELLAEAALPPEHALAPGEAIDLPDWLAALPEDTYEQHFEVEEFTDEEALAPDIPDWLRELEDDVETEDIPGWLVESLDEPVVQAAPEPIAVEPEPPAPPVTFVPGPPAAENVQVLEAARERAQAGNLDEALLAYETLIRASAALEPVVADLQSLARQHRDQPAVYRVLGDGLMRQGKLQAALDTYREALNHL